MLRYLSEFAWHATDGDLQQLTHGARNNSEEIMEESKTKIVVHDGVTAPK